MVPSSVHYSRQNSSGGCLAVRLTKAHSGWPNTHPCTPVTLLAPELCTNELPGSHTPYGYWLYEHHTFRVMLHTHLFLCVDLYTPDKSKQQDSLNLILHTNFIFLNTSFQTMSTVCTVPWWGLCQLSLRWLSSKHFPSGSVSCSLLSACQTLAHLQCTDVNN